MLPLTERRERLGRVLAGTACVSPASVYDPLSARAAQTAGFDVGIVAGSVASFVALAAPDLGLLTLTELADHVRRMARASDLSPIVDADHGFGNALNAMRTVEELEHAGAAAVMLEDGDLPVRSSGNAATVRLIPVGEMTGKLRAAVAARRDDALVIGGRTGALGAADGGVSEAVTRVRAFTDAGVDAILLVHVDSTAQLDAVRAATALPIIVGYAAPSITRDELAARGVRLLLTGHQPLAASLRALADTYADLHRGGSPSGAAMATGEEVERLVRTADHQRLQELFLPPAG